MDNRVRKLNVETLSKEQVDNLSEQIGERLRKIVDQACDEANRICQVYGMQVKMQFSIEQIPEDQERK